MPISFTSFTPSTVAQSGQVNINFNTLKTFIESLRPQLHSFVPDLLIAGTNQSAEFVIKTQNTLYLSSVQLHIKTAPTGQAIIVDINKNGSSIFSTRPQIAVGATSGGSSAVFSAEQVVDGDVITVDIDQVGTTEPGRNLTATLTFSF